MDYRPRERLAFNARRQPAVVSAGPGVDAPRERAVVRPFTPPSAKVRPERSDWAYRGLLAFTAVLMLRPQDQIPGLGALHLAEMFALVGVAAMASQRLARHLPIVRLTPETVSLMAFGGAILFSLPFSIWPGGVFGVFIDSWIKMLVVFVLMLNTLGTPRRLEQITWLIIVSCGYICALSLYYYSRGINLVEGDRLGGPLGGIFGNPNDLALNMVSFLPSAVVLAMTPRASGGRRFTASLVVLLMLATIVLTKSRGAMLGLAAVVCMLIFTGHRVRKGFAAVMIGVLVSALPFVPSSVWSRMATIVDSERDRTEFTGSREARSTVMKEGIQVFLERPLWGVGAGQFPNYDPPGRKEKWRETHNALIQVAAETGVPGLIAFALMIVRAWRAARTTRRLVSPLRKGAEAERSAAAFSADERWLLQRHSVALSAGLLGWLICSQFASVAYNWTFYYLFALVVAGRDLTVARLRQFGIKTA